MPFSDNLPKENFGRGKVGNGVGWNGRKLCRGREWCLAFWFTFWITVFQMAPFCCWHKKHMSLKNEDTYYTKEASRRTVNLTAHTRNYFKGTVICKKVEFFPLCTSKYKQINDSIKKGVFQVALFTRAWWWSTAHVLAQTEPTSENHFLFPLQIICFQK